MERHSYAIHWSAILGGSFVALGAWMLLYALGAALGGQTDPLEGLDRWSSVYLLVSPIIALFIGGLIASKARGVSSRKGGALHGAIIWGFCMVLGAVVLGSASSLMFAATTPGVGMIVPTGYLWAMTGAIFGSLVAACVGASIGPGSRTARHVPPPVSERHPITPAERREVYP